MNNPVLIAVALDERSANNIIDELEKTFPHAHFSRIREIKSHTWKVHAAPVFGYDFNSELIKETCLKLIHEK